MLYATALLSLAALANADTFRSVGSRAGQNPQDIIDLSQLGAPGTFVNSPTLVSTFLGNLALIGDINGGQAITAVQGNNWNGNFDFGESLLWTGNSNFGIGGGGPLGIVLATPVRSFGFTIQADVFGPFTATLQAFDTSGNSLFTQSFNGKSSGAGNGSANFVGLMDLTGANISAILITSDSGVNFPQFANDFAIDNPSFTYTVTPEPGAMALMAGGLLGMAGLLRRRSRKGSSQV